MYLLLFLILGIQALGPKPSLKAGISNEMLTQLKDAAIKQVSKMPDVQMPDFEKDIGVAKITARNITMSIKPFKPNQFEIELVDKSSDFWLNGTKMALNGSMIMSIKVLFVTVECKAYINVSDANFSARVSLLQNGSKLEVNVTEVDIELDADLIGIELECNIAKSILDMIIKYLKLYFFENIKVAMSQMMPASISDFVNLVLGDLPDDVVILPGLAVKFGFTDPPEVVGGFMMAPLLIFGHQVGNNKPPPYYPPDLPRYNTSCHKGLQLFLSDYIIRSVVEAAHLAGVMKFEMKTTVSVFGKQFDIAIACNTNTTPLIEFNANIQFTGSIYCVLEARYDKYRPYVGFLANTGAVLNEHVAKSKIYPSIESLVIKDLKIIWGKEWNANIVLFVLNTIINILRSYVNIELERKGGIPLPAFPLFDISDVEQTLIGRYISLCGTLKPKLRDYHYVPRLHYRPPPNYPLI